jgi:hypothetical protein
MIIHLLLLGGLSYLSRHARLRVHAHCQGATSLGTEMHGTSTHLQMTCGLIQRLGLGLNASNLGVISRLLL